MKILHTSDWHLGRTLYGRKRYEEFTSFLDWLLQTISDEKIDILLIAGDIFDSSLPGNRAQELYYRFLCQVATSCCRHVVIIAGNHDSPSLLNAPKELLRRLHVYVVGKITDDRNDEVFTLYHNGIPELIVCAVPYLRDKDIRTVEPGETIDDKNAKLVSGLKNHYADVCVIAQQRQAEFKSTGYNNVPIVAMGHLFVAGGKTVDDDGVRQLYVGSLVDIGAEAFPPAIDYLALGHLHVPQTVNNVEHLRYCGSPIPMGYGEASQQKKIVVVEFNNSRTTIGEIAVPCFQQLVRISGNLANIQKTLTQLKRSESSAWLEIEYSGSATIANLRGILEEAIAGSALEIRRITNRRVIERLNSMAATNETLDDLDAGDVFDRCLDSFAIPAAERDQLTLCYQEIVRSIEEEDRNAE